MAEFDRRKFLKFIGGASALMLADFPGQVMAKTDQAAATGGKNGKIKKIAVEEHISWQEYSDYVSYVKSQPSYRGYKNAAPPPPEMMAELFGMQGPSTDVLGDLANIDLRLKDMDAAGIDMQVVSIRNPGVEEFDMPDGRQWAVKINDKLAELVHTYPDRFAAFAVIPWQDPAAATLELERAVKELGLVGVKTDSTILGDYLDSPKYLPVWKKAEALGVPVFLHPEEPPAEMIAPYLTYNLEGAGWGYAADAGLHAVRLIASGLFDECPGLNVILGHMGEGLPFWLWRLDSKGGRSTLRKKPGEYVRRNFYAATSGNFFHAALVCTCMALGPERVLFGVDFPSESNQAGVDFLETAPIAQEDREKIFHLNAEKLFGV